jgi:hypothetical protein
VLSDLLTGFQWTFPLPLQVGFCPSLSRHRSDYISWWPTCNSALKITSIYRYQDFNGHSNILPKYQENLRVESIPKSFFKSTTYPWFSLKCQQTPKKKHSLKYVLVVFTGIVDKNEESLIRSQKVKEKATRSQHHQGTNYKITAHGWRMILHQLL